MAIPDEDVAKVRAATDIAALIGEHTSLKRVGRRLSGLCPFHAEKSPSFSVNPEEGLYYCFGCQASGDAISFVRRIEGLDFVVAVERLAARAGVTIRNDADPGDAAARNRRQQIYEAIEAAVALYHEILMSDSAASRARGYLRARGYDGDVVRHFRIGFAPPSFDTVVRRLKFPESTMLEAGLVGKNDRGRVYDVFRERIIFPIFDPGGRAIALGGRILPEEMRTMQGGPSQKYRNSAESAVYQKRATLYGLNWAKTEITATKEAVVCEGYTDVIGLFGAGVRRAVATCGTSLTEDHVRLLSRFAPRLVLCFDQDKAGQNAAARLYEWERRHEIELAVAALPEGSDPADLARTDPAALQLAISSARPFLGFRVDRALDGEDLSAPEGRTRAAERAVDAISEHPNPLVRDQYLVAVADRTHHTPEQLRALLADALAHPRVDEHASADRGTAHEPPPRDEPELDDGPGDGTVDGGFGTDELRAGRDALRLAISRPEDVAGWLDECLFADLDQRSAFVALAGATELHEAIERAPSRAAALIRRLATFGTTEDIDPDGVLLELVRNAASKAVTEAQADARRGALAGDLDAVAAAGGRVRWLKEELELLRDPVQVPGRASVAIEAAHRLLAWLVEAHREG
jgi:DNA primase